MKIDKYLKVEDNRFTNMSNHHRNRGGLLEYIPQDPYQAQYILTLHRQFHFPGESYSYLVLFRVVSKYMKQRAH